MSETSRANARKKFNHRGTETQR